MSDINHYTYNQDHIRFEKKSIWLSRFLKGKTHTIDYGNCLDYKNVSGLSIKELTIVIEYEDIKAVIYFKKRKDLFKVFEELTRRIK